ncbi:MAG: hypothetical protein HKO03_01715 [Acidimicrobiia bacterium]|nr:hypothetical protein [Acidimicrobiia bacterium]
MTFENWMRAVNAVIARLGLDYRDLPDIDYHGLWESEATPADAADNALSEAGFPGLT